MRRSQKNTIMYDEFGNIINYTPAREIRSRNGRMSSCSRRVYLESVASIHSTAVMPSELVKNA